MDCPRLVSLALSSLDAANSSLRLSLLSSVSHCTGKPLVLNDLGIRQLLAYLERADM